MMSANYLESGVDWAQGADHLFKDLAICSQEVKPISILFGSRQESFQEHDPPDVVVYAEPQNATTDYDCFFRNNQRSRPNGLGNVRVPFHKPKLIGINNCNMMGCALVDELLQFGDRLLYGQVVDGAAKKVSSFAIHASPGGLGDIHPTLHARPVDQSRQG